jgi:hypothetical protein
MRMRGWGVRAVEMTAADFWFDREACDADGAKPPVRIS